MSFKHPIPISSSTTILVNSGWTVTVMFFDTNKKYIGTSETYYPGEHILNSPAGTAYIGIKINIQSIGSTGVGGPVTIVTISSIQ